MDGFESDCKVDVRAVVILNYAQSEWIKASTTGRWSARYHRGVMIVRHMSLP
jgi:hypothetical protein